MNFESIPSRDNVRNKNKESLGDAIEGASLDLAREFIPEEDNTKNSHGGIRNQRVIIKSKEIMQEIGVLLSGMDTSTKEMFLTLGNPREALKNYYKKMTTANKKKNAA